MNLQCYECFWGQNARCKILECKLEDVPDMVACLGFVPLPESVGYGE